MKQYTKAAFLQNEGTETPVFVRFQRLFMVKVLQKQRVIHVGSLLNFIQKKEIMIS